MSSTLGLVDADLMVQDFLQTYQTGLQNIHRIHFKHSNQVSFSALIELLKDELRTGCVSVINKNLPPEEIKSYLFYIANAFCRKLATNDVKKKSVNYICPGCLFLGMATVVSFNRVFQCEECQSQLKCTSDPKKVAFYKAFSVHNKKGYRCPDCHRFIPHPIDNVSTVACPYFDCAFVGECQQLKIMHHTTSSTNPEKLVLDMAQDGRSFKDNLIDSTDDVLTSLEHKENIKLRAEIIQEVISSQISYVAYSGSDFTVQHKQCVYQAFQELLKRQPEDMVRYLLDNSRSGGFQHKVFQEYIRLLEASMPFSIKKGTKRYRVDSLLSEHLCLFSGISVFNSVISDKLEVKNGTNEYYIGGRKGSYTQPYYIGKLLNVLQSESKQTLLPAVQEYSFSKIKFKNVKPGTPVIITHLRIPPHYQMGGMVYVNRVRKKIVERAKTLLKQNEDIS